MFFDQDEQPVEEVIEHGISAGGGYTLSHIRRDFFTMTNPTGETIVDPSGKPFEFATAEQAMDMVRAEFTHSNESIVAESDIITKEQ
ncbi:hypothetical protein [uncultured Gordonia sp.]|uniref:hypothetical protein n=1 Tax=uncultured Gordonia sp. TaxID=198437 RepID=UPI0026355E93|nr:hypothetical protein [uncultured Gordonia sp.]